MATDVDDLVRAADAGDIDAVKELIAAGVSVNEPTGAGNLPLARAALRGRTEVVKLLLKAGANVNAASTHMNRSALMMAAQGGHVDTVAVLLAAGADVNQEGIGGTPLTSATYDGTESHLKIVRALLTAGADVNGASSTVAMKATRNSSCEVLKVLIEAGASVNAVTRLGSALSMAIAENRPQHAAMLLAAGADAHVRFPADVDFRIAGKTPLEYARETKAKKIVALIESAQQPSAKTPTVSLAKPAESWKRIEAWLKEHKPRRWAALHTGASPEDLALVEKTVAQILPEDFKEAYRVHNGQENGHGDLVPCLAEHEAGYFLMPTEAMVSEWKSWKSLAEIGEFAGQEASPDQGIEGVWWNPGWVPFASNGGGDSICLDLAPAPGGVVGQVITMNHASRKRVLLASSFSEWLADLADAIQDGALEE